VRHAAQVRLARFSSGGTGIALIVANLLAFWYFARSWPQYGNQSFSGYRLDLDVYRIGSTIWRHGGSLYGPLPTTTRGLDLPFTYPPAAAIVFAPLSLLPFWLASLAVTVLTVAALLVVLALVVRALGLTVDWRVLGALLPLAVATEPVRQTLGYGQVNVLLMLLVAVDCLTTSTRWPRGVLVGVAAAVKLTPAAFVLFFLVRRDWRGVVRVLVGFAVPTGLGFLFDPHDSALYWTKLVFDSGRIGGIDFAGNQSLLAVITRFDVPAPLATELWGVLVVATLVIATIGMRRALRERQVVFALALNAVAELLCSPISWSHHWVWLVPLFCGLAVLGRRPAIVLLSAGLVLCYLGPQWWFPKGLDRELSWPLWAKFVGSSYVYYGIAVLVTAIRLDVRRPRGPVPANVAEAQLAELDQAD
jgi:alpha-1,2-mannosyltransferase